jgi:hypothetical protein
MKAASRGMLSPRCCLLPEAADQQENITYCSNAGSHAEFDRQLASTKAQSCVLASLLVAQRRHCEAFIIAAFANFCLSAFGYSTSIGMATANYSADPDPPGRHTQRTDTATGLNSHGGAQARHYAEVSCLDGSSLQRAARGGCLEH